MSGMPRTSTPGQIAASDAPLVGRATELERVLSALRNTVELGRGRLVVLAGEPGVGKTRLAGESLAHAHALGVHGFVGRCFEEHTAVPFFPFAEPFAAALAQAPAELQAERPSRWPELAHIVPELGTPSSREGQATQLQVIRSSWPTLAGFVATLAETLMCLQAPDAEAVLIDAERLIEETDKPGAQPQLLRARGLLPMGRGDLTGAIEILDASAAVARSQHAVIQLGRTLAVLTDTLRKHGDGALAAQADVERATVVERIGPEVRGLAWAQDLPSARYRARAGSRTTHRYRTGPLSPRGREVAVLVAEGLSDRQIADRLVITEGTTGVHMGHIVNKLGFHARTEIASWAPAPNRKGRNSDQPLVLVGRA